MRLLIQTLDLAEVGLWILVMLGIKKVVRKHPRPNIPFIGIGVAAVGFSYLAMISFFRIPHSVVPSSTVVQLLFAHFVIDLGLVVLVVASARALRLSNTRPKEEVSP